MAYYHLSVISFDPPRDTTDTAATTTKTTLAIRHNRPIIIGGPYYTNIVIIKSLMDIPDDHVFIATSSGIALRLGHCTDRVICRDVAAHNKINTTAKYFEYL